MQSPLLGFNNNVRHRGRLFHIQTEDSGVRHPHVITHLYMDGGRILKTVKTSYAGHIGSDALAKVVRELMKEQHKMMFIALRDGQFDHVLDPDEAAHPRVPVSLVSVAKDAAVSAHPPAATELIASPSPQAAKVDVTPEPRSAATSKKDTRDRHSSGRYAVPRPVALFASGRNPETGSIFGDDLISEKSLDEVILSYLSEDLDTSSTKK